MADSFENYFYESTPKEYRDYAARYDLTFLTPCSRQLRCKVWVTKKDGKEKLEGIPIPVTDVRNIMEEIHFTDESTRLRSRGWVVLPSRRCLQADILFPGCEFDCRLIINEHAGRAKRVAYKPEEEVIRVLARYLSGLTLKDDDPFGLRLPENEMPQGFRLIHKRLSKRNVYTSKPGFSVILSKEISWSADATNGSYRESTDVHLHCEEWDRLLSGGLWKPESLVQQLPEFLEFVKEVQCFVVAALKSNGVERKVAVPPAIRARGPLALATYLNALAEGQACVRRVPLLIVGQDRSGKTSVKKSLKGICFDPEEDSTKGIDVDCYQFKVTTEIWKTGKKDEANIGTEVISFEHKTAQWVAEKLTTREKVAEVKRTSSVESNEEIASPEESEPNENPSLADVLESSRNPVPTNTTDHEPHLPTGEVRTPTELEPEVDFLPTSLERLPDFDEVATVLPQLLRDNWEDDREDIFSIMWDFAGQSVYYVTHPLFLTRRAIYFLVYDLSRDPSEEAKPLSKQGVYEEIEDKHNLKTNFDYLDFWMSSLASLVEQSDCQQVDPETGVPLKKFPAVFLVCTHADHPYNNRDSSKLASKIFGDLKKKPYGAHLFDVFCVDNTKSGTESECKEIMRLREAVHFVSKKLPHVNEVIPIKWLRYENVLRVLKEDDHKFITLSTAKYIASKFCNINENEVQTLLNFLHDLRVLIHFDDSPELREVVFLDIQWLIDVFKSVITVRFHREDKEFAHLWEKLQEEGILEEKLLKNVWSSLTPRKKTHKTLIAIMEKFSLMCPWPSSDDSSNKHFLVPSMLQTLPPNQISHLVDSSQIPSLFLKFDTGRVPPGLFPRFVLEFLQWCRKEFPGVDLPKTFNNFARFSIFPEQGLSVVLLCHSSTIEVVVLSVKSATDVVDVASIRAFRNQLTSIIDRMWQKFFWVKNVGCEVSFLCPVCSHGRVVSFCTRHRKESCEQEECLHFISESNLRDEMLAVCNNSVTTVDNRIQVEQFAPWISPGKEKMETHQRGGGTQLGKGISDGCQKKSPVLPGEAVTYIQPHRPSIGNESNMLPVPFPQGNPGYCQVQPLVAEQFEGEFNQLQDAVNESKGTVDRVSEATSLSALTVKVPTMSRQLEKDCGERKLRVTLLSAEWKPSSNGDLTTINRELAIQMAKHPNVEVSVFLPQCSEEDKKSADSNYSVKLIEAVKIPGYEPDDWLASVPDGHAMDCVIGHGVGLGRQIPLIKKNKKCSHCKWIQVVHSAPEEIGMYKSISKGQQMQKTEIELCEMADQVVAIGPKLTEIYKRQLKKQDVFNLTPSIFTEFSDVQQASDERKTFCVLVIESGDSEDFDAKGYEIGAKAIANLQDKSYQLKFATKQRGKEDEIAEKLLQCGISRNQLIVRSFDGDRETLANLFCEVDIAILPSRSEGFGLSALEAISAGLPVLVSENSGIAQALHEVPHGSQCIVDSEDPAKWASAIKAVSRKTRNLRLEEAKILCHNYFKVYSWEKPCGDLVKMMYELAFGGSGDTRNSKCNISSSSNLYTVRKGKSQVCE
ncbi:uncharacterized protein LOC111344458 isoform X2 [Stylophora pistillata]|uniref:uncharacterized protein LOC111344458 isoform X2 n=1 Tax=Stylophora pistillata TaxID=50429 RepID=UPI000C047A06|nr:uncharacterized protein LOC111344458 isoform X2 [Stylophora pistillata]